MQLFISSAEDLSACIPNKIAPAVGEPSLFEKIMPYVVTAQHWADRHLCSVGFAGRNTELREAMRGVVAASALHDALGGLDLILTPNGFGIVSTETVAPASRERVDAMRRDLIALRDSRIIEAFEILADIPEWRETPAFSEWARCLLMPTFPMFQTVDGRFSLQLYQERSQAIADKEERLADSCLSHPLLERLRLGIYRPEEQSHIERTLCRLVRNTACRWAMDDDPPAMADRWDIVDAIRRDSELFAIWQTTRQSRLYHLPGFENQKSSAGFYF